MKKARFLVAVCALLLAGSFMYVHAQVSGGATVAPTLVYTLGSSGSTDTLNAVTYGGSSFLAVGQNSKVVRGTVNGNNVALTNDTFVTPGLNLTAATYGNGSYVVGGPVEQVFASSNNSWTLLPAGMNTAEYGPINALTYVNNNFIAAPRGTFVFRSSGTNLTSPWIHSVQPWLGVSQRAMTTFGTQGVVVVGDSKLTLLSSDGGANFPIINNYDSRTKINYLGVAASGGDSPIIVIVGTAGTIVRSLARSFVNGLTWPSVTSGVSTSLNAVTWTGTQFIAVGDAGVILTSPDGTTWTKQVSPTTANLRAIASSPSGTVMIVGDNGTVLVGGTSAMTITPPSGGTVTPPPASSITGLTANVSGSKVTLTWNAANASQYAIFRNRSMIGTSFTASFTDPSGLTAGTYTYNVATYANGVIQTPSNPVTATVTATNGGITPPDRVIINNQITPAPSSFTLTISMAGAGRGTVTAGALSCNSGSNTCPLPFSSGAHVTLQATPDSNSRFIGWDNLCSGSQPTCSVTVASNMIVTATFAPYSTADTQAPTQPTNLQAPLVASNRVYVNWTASTDTVGVAGYKVYLNGSQVDTSTAAGYNFGSANITPGTSYTVGVAAYDAAGNTSPMATLQVSVPAATVPPSVPDHITTTRTSASAVTITWWPSVPASGTIVMGYYVYRDGNTTSYATVAQSNSTILSDGRIGYSYTDTSASGTHSYTVAAYDKKGNTSALSAASSVTALSTDTSKLNAAIWDAVRAYVNRAH